MTTFHLNDDLLCLPASIVKEVDIAINALVGPFLLPESVKQLVVRITFSAGRMLHSEA